jgi:ABC-type glycerol-3-phosphate transport system substrate-binding protein
MKKNSIVLLVIGLSIAFAACSGTKKSEAPAEEPVKNETVEEVIAPPPPADLKLSPEKALKAFQDYAKAYAEAYNNIMKAPQKFKELSSQYQARIAEMEKIKSELNEKQQKEYQKAIELIIKVNKGGK